MHVSVRSPFSYVGQASLRYFSTPEASVLVSYTAVSTYTARSGRFDVAGSKFSSRWLLRVAGACLKQCVAHRGMMGVWVPEQYRSKEADVTDAPCFEEQPLSLPLNAVVLLLHSLIG